MAVLISVIFGISFFLGIVLPRAWIACYLWEWFVVPLGVPEIGMAHAIGLSTVVYLFFGNNNQKTNEYKSKEDEFLDIAAFWIESLLFAFVAFGIGAIAHYFM